MSLFFPHEDDDSDPRWDETLEDLANERLAIRRRQARDADSMAETGIPYYDPAYDAETETAR